MMREYTLVSKPSQSRNYMLMTEPAPIVTAVIEKLRALRKEKGLSHDKVAQKTGLHRTTIGQIEAGKIQPTLLTCLKIAQALDIRLSTVLAKSEES